MSVSNRDLKLIAAGVGLLIFAPRLVGWLAAKAAVGAGTVVLDTASGVVIGVAEAVGIPPTDAAKCAADVEAGDWWAASFSCPAGTYLKSAAGAIYDTATGAVVGQTAPSAAPEIVAVTPIGADEFQAWYAATGGVLLPGETQAQAIERWRAGTVAAEPVYADEWGGGLYGEALPMLPGESPGTDVNIADYPAA
jgi:hypothetical protein